MVEHIPNQGTRFCTLSTILLVLFSCNGFDADKWKNDPESRRKQSDLLIKAKLLIKKTYPEVAALFGN